VSITTPRAEVAGDPSRVRPRAAPQFTVMAARFNPTPLLLLFGLVALGLAGLSIGDMFLPRPYDGVVLETDNPRLVVREVIPGSGADRAGIRAGDEIIGIAREIIHDYEQAASLLNRRRIGEELPYLVKTTGGERVERRVRLDRRRIGDGSYLYVCGVAVSFFFLGLFVLVRQPAQHASQVFFLLSGLFMLALVCRLRPASYSGVDTVVLSIGSLAMLFLPSAILHFYLVFPRPAWLQVAAESPGRTGRLTRLALRWGWPMLYAVPVVVLVASVLLELARGAPGRRLAGSPAASWWLLVIFVLLGLFALRANARHLGTARERRGVLWVLVGSLLGLAPFLIAMLVVRDSRSLFWFGVLPLILVPITFTYAIVRFQLFDIRIILRRSLLYTITTVIVTGVYAFAIAGFNAAFRGSDLASSSYFPVVLALAIVLLFEPLRRRLQDPVDRFFFGERARLRQATMQLGEALTAKVDPEAVVRELVEKLPRLVDLRFAALYLLRGDALECVAGPDHLPATLPLLPPLQRFLNRRRRLTRLDQLGALPIRSPEVAAMARQLEEAGVEAIGELASSRRWIGLVLLSEKRGRMPLEREELELLQGLLHQACLALETGMLLAERTQQAELERELEIAARIQADLNPGRLCFAAGWEVAAVCQPARDVGGDFFAQLPAPAGGAAVVYGDVSGKSVSGALMMMAAHEALHALAIAEPDPGRLFALTNRRLYELGRRRFVALGYLGVSADGEQLRYLLAGQPPLLLRRRDGRVSELPLPPHRIPVGALANGSYQPIEVPVAPGEIVLGYSDGVTEAAAPSGEFFGEERLIEALASTAGGPEEVVRGVERAIAAFTRGAPQYDDLTLVAVGRLPRSRPPGRRAAAGASTARRPESRS